MNNKFYTVLLILIFVPAISLCGDIVHGPDPRGTIEKIAGEWNFTWDLNSQKYKDWVKKKNESGQDFSIQEIKWYIKGKGQNWVFTKITRMGDDINSTIKRERFWVDIIRVDGIWVTRTKYRYNEGKYNKNDSHDVTKNNKGRKFTASCRLMNDKITLSILKKKQARVFRISKKNGLLCVNYITIPDLTDSTFHLKPL
jgi:hypothetical protein